MSLHIADEGAVRTLTIENPGKKNALDDEIVRELRDTLIATAYDDGIRVVVLTGAGGDFGSGADIATLGEGAHPLRKLRIVNEVAAAIHDLPQPVIAKVRGVAVGASLNLALGCDFVVADTSARFCEIFARRGLSLDGGGSWVLPRLVGMLQAKRLALLADMVDAQEALELGLITWLKEPEELDGFVAELASLLAAGPPIALAQSKALLHQSASSTFHDALLNEGTVQTVNFATDAPIAVKAFAAKETPEFEGKFRG